LFTTVDRKKDFAILIIINKSLTFYIREEDKKMLLPSDISREELLSYLRPLYPNGIFPLGAGWRIVLCTVLSAAAIGFLIYHSPRMKRRREAFQAFGTLRQTFFFDGDISALAGGLSVLMRRVALHRFGREKTAGLNGRLWTDFLKQTGADLSEQNEQLLAFQAYAPSSFEQNRVGGKDLLRCVQRWLERNL